MNGRKKWEKPAALILAVCLIFSGMQLSYAALDEAPKDPEGSVQQEEQVSTPDTGEAAAEGGAQEGEGDEEALPADAPADEETPADTEEEPAAPAAPDSQSMLLRAPAQPGGLLGASGADFNPADVVTDGIVEMKKQGIKVNLYDYGPASIDSGWSGTDRAQNEQGINAGKTLKFYSNGIGAPENGVACGYNNWTGSPVFNTGQGATANQGIVQNTLEGGFPKLAVGNKESLKYLFDPNTPNDYRTDYIGVDGLLKKTGGSGSAYRVGYACEDNYARLNTATNQFTLYDGTYYCSGQEASGPIGFFPFNDPDKTKTEVAGANMRENGGYYDHHFGMMMDAEFAVTPDGMLGGEEMTFDFSGDDDMWVFIDGVLVLDIGGIHQPVAATINFKDGTVSMKEAPIYDGTHGDARIMSAVQKASNTPYQNESNGRQQAGDGNNSYYYDTAGNQVLLEGNNMKLSEIFELAGRTWDNTPFKNHRIQAFYLERGGMYSNLDISMNLLITKDIEFSKKIVDRDGNPVVNLDDYYVDEDTTYGFKVEVQKNGTGDDYFVYTGKDGAEDSGIFAFGGYDVYDNGVKMDDANKPKFDENGVIQLTRTQQVRVKGIPSEWKYKISEVGVSKEAFAGTTVNEETRSPSDNGDGTYNVTTGELQPITVQKTTFENMAIEQPKKKETDPHVGTGDLGPVRVGQQVDYEIEYENYQDQAADVVITDKLDPGVDYVSSSPKGVYDEATHTVTWTIEDVPQHGASDASGKVALSVKVNSSAKEAGKIANTAAVKVGNDAANKTTEVTNPVADPHKQETAPYIGNDLKIPDPEDSSKLIDNPDGELGPVDVGTEISYQISYKNYQTEPATVTIKDTLDPNVTVVPGSISDGGALVESGEDAGKVVWTLPDVPAGQEGTVTLKVKVLEGGKTAGKVVNTASVAVGSDAAYDTESVTNPVKDVPEKKETAPYEGTGELGAVQPGQEITYTIGYKNYRSKLSPVVITDVLDPNVTFVSADNDGKATTADGKTTVTWTLKDVPAGQEGTVTLTVKVKDDKDENGEFIVKGETVANKASVKVYNDAAVETNEVTNPVPEDPHKKETNPYDGTGLLGGVNAGDELTYEISYKNYKSTPATVVITDPLDPNVTFVEASESGAEGTGENAGKVIWTLENVPAGQEGTVTLKVKVKDGVKGQLINNSASVQVGNDPLQKTETVTNPTSTDPVKTETTPGDDVAVRPGDTITYNVSYENYHPKRAKVVVTDTLDTNVDLVEGSISEGGVYNPTSRTITWTFNDVPAKGEDGSAGVVSFRVTVKDSAAQAGKVRNQAGVKVDNDKLVETNIVENPVPEDPVKEEITPFEGTGELGGVKPGQEITYKVSYKNYKKTAADVAIRDTLDPNVEFVRASDDGVNDNGTVKWTISSVPAGKEGYVTLTVKVREDKDNTGAVIAQGQTVKNKAVVNVGNDSDYTTNEVSNPVPEDPHKEETAPYTGSGELGGVKPGQDITYKVSYKNYKSSAADVVITDALDPNVTFKEASDGGAVGTGEDAGKVHWTIRNVGAGEEGFVTLTVTVKEDKDENGAYIAQGQTILNQAKVNVGNDGEFDTEEVTNPVPEDPKKLETAPYTGTGEPAVEELGAVKPGDTITYHINYENYRSTDQTVKVIDMLDQNVEFVSAGQDGQYDEDAHLVVWEIPTAAKTAGTVDLTVKVRTDKDENGKYLAQGKTVKNKAVVQVGNDNSFATNEEDNPVPEDPEKKETQPFKGTGLLGGVTAGEDITYEISYKNYKSEAADIVITDTLDPNVTFKEASDDGAPGEGDAAGTVTWTIPKVAAGAEGTVTLTVTVNEDVEGELINNQAHVKVGNDAVFDTEVVTNPTKTTPVKAEPTPGAGRAARAGSTVKYEVSYDNYMPDAATVVITDALDSNVEVVESSISDDGVYDTESHTITWTLKDVPAHGAEGAAGKVSFEVTVKESAQVANEGPGKIENGASVKVGNDSAVETNRIENPVPDDPVKTESDPGAGKGLKVGDEVSYSISYENYRTDTDTATVIVTDVLDTGLDYVADSAEPAEGFTYDESTRTLTWTLENVPSKEKGTVSFKAEVNESAKSDDYAVLNTAGVKVSDDPAVNTNTIKNPVPEDPKKMETAPYEGTGTANTTAADGASVEELGGVKPGEEVTYKVEYKNYKDKAADVVITDVLDEHVSFVSASDDGAVAGASGDEAAGGTVTWTISDVAPGASGTVTLTVKVLDSARTAGMIRNQATVNVDNDGDYETGITENPVPDEPKKAETAPYEGTGETDEELGGVKPGEDITYTISYKNYKSKEADVEIRDVLDPNVTFKEASDGGAEKSSGGTSTVVWKLEKVPAGEEGTVTLTVTVKDTAKGKVIANKASVKVGNDAAFDTHEVTNPVPEDPKKVETAPYQGTGTKDEELGGVKPGEEITYEIRYKNYKSTEADVTISDPLDPNVEFISASDGGAVAEQTVVWTLEKVPAHSEGVVTLTVKVKEEAKGSAVKNSAVVTVGNDADFKTHEVTNPVPEDPKKLEIKPYEGNGETDEELGGVKPGEQITYTIDYKNYKSSDADVVIRDALDPNVRFVSASDEGELEKGETLPGGEQTPDTVVWKISDVPAGQEGSVTLTVEVLAEAKGGAVKNRAVVKVGNDADFETHEVTNPVPEDPEKVEITPFEGTGLLGGVSEGEEITYEIRYKNYKSTDADVVIRDPLDPHVDFVSASDDGALEQPGDADTPDADGAGEEPAPDEQTQPTVVWTIKDVPAGEEGTVTLTVRVKDGVKGELVNNQAYVTVGNDEEFETAVVTNPTTTDPVKTETRPGADKVTRVGSQVDYEISYNNYRPETADVVITDKLDPNVKVIEESISDGGSYDKQTHTITWTLKDVPAAGEEGAAGTVAFSVTVQPGALLSADGEGIIKNGTSVKVGNDKAIDTNVIENPVPEDPVKTEIKPGDGKAVQVGDEINYSITYENYEKDVATVTVTDVLDEGLDFVEAAPAKCATYDAKTRTVTWVIPNVPARQGGAVSLTVKVNGKATANDSKVRNTAGVQVGDDPVFMTNIVENPAKVPPANGRKTRTGDNSIGLLAALVCVVSGSLLLASRRRRKTSADR